MVTAAIGDDASSTIRSPTVSSSRSVPRSDQLHHRRRSERLGVGGDAEQVMVGEWFAGRDVGDTVRRGQHHLVFVQHRRLHARNPIRSAAELRANGRSTQQRRRRADVQDRSSPGP